MDKWLGIVGVIKSINACGIVGETLDEDILD